MHDTGKGNSSQERNPIGVPSLVEKREDGVAQKPKIISTAGQGSSKKNDTKVSAGMVIS